jgi:predicted nucleotidyltransferase
MQAMIRQRPLAADVATRLSDLRRALERCNAVVFACLFGGAGRGNLKPRSDVDVAVYLDETANPQDARLEAVGAVTSHLGTDEVDVVVLNTAPTALVGRIPGSRRVVLDRQPFRRHRFESQALRAFLDFRILEHTLLSRRYPGG